EGVEPVRAVDTSQVAVAAPGGLPYARGGYRSALDEEPGDDVCAPGIESGPRFDAGQRQPVTRVVPDGEVAAEQPAAEAVRDALQGRHAVDLATSRGAGFDGAHLTRCRPRRRCGAAPAVSP